MSEFLNFWRVSIYRQETIWNSDVQQVLSIKTDISQKNDFCGILKSWKTSSIFGIIPNLRKILAPFPKWYHDISGKHSKTLSRPFWFSFFTGKLSSESVIFAFSFMYFQKKSAKPPALKGISCFAFFVFEMFDIVATRVFKYFRFNIFELNNNRLYARQERPLTPAFDSSVR